MLLNPIRLNPESTVRSRVKPPSNSSALIRASLGIASSLETLDFAYNYHSLYSLSLPIHTANNWIALHLYTRAVAGVISSIRPTCEYDNSAKSRSIITSRKCSGSRAMQHLKVSIRNFESSCSSGELTLPAFRTVLDSRFLSAILRLNTVIAMLLAVRKM
jgi:hypothetical protein